MRTASISPSRRTCMTADLQFHMACTSLGYGRWAQATPLADDGSQTVSLPCTLSRTPNWTTVDGGFTPPCSAKCLTSHMALGRVKAPSLAPPGTWKQGTTPSLSASFLATLPWTEPGMKYSTSITNLAHGTSRTLPICWGTTCWTPWTTLARRRAL
jgi:hypothetical protein